ncbi:molybdate ABC transporter substrate-binding protein [Methylocella tundrae]|uniref:Molybdate transporter subunit periplasmic-binding component of ABC superfamily n=1 Tax=Methylocella tundrae TaxID=227605 RepID=A0A4U8YUJ4_METTU|nr:molybdate ABC transporter substrate-binding protein [Methylocella tundrae]WPP04753.1 molybdate ABC transporter substrate-binding protein [Methylocella tundrae]VFU06959.1 molybdate transporter subunit; periplasmic-binding component of ABC superfamily [Methylocella tundrae]
MRFFARRAFNALALCLALARPGLPQTASAQTAATAGPTVFAAASMKTALDAIAASWTAQTGKAPAIVYGSSAVLAKQIEQAAPADIFIAADVNWADYLEKAKLLRPGTRRNVLGNALVLIEPADSNITLKIEPGFDLAGATGDGRIAVCTIASCPGGIYAKQSLEKLGVWDKVEPKLAQADNIRSALNLVSRGEARFGIVYATDAKADPKVKVVDTFPDSTHSPIVYPVAVLEGSKNSMAASFVAYLSSQAATKILLDQGFTVLSK